MFNLLSATAEYSNLFVVLMGIGTVFVGLIVLIFCCYVLGLLMKKNNNTEEAKAVTPSPVATPVADARIENKQELVAAISAAVAENLGRDVSAIRILSIKKV